MSVNACVVLGKLAHNFNDNTFISNYHIVSIDSMETFLIMIRNKLIKNEFKGPKWSIISDKNTNVFQKKFSICDVAQGLIWDPLFRQKGIPLYERIIIQRK